MPFGGTTGADYRRKYKRTFERTYVVSGRLTLDYCGGTSDGSGWEGSNYYHTYVPGQFPGHRVTGYAGFGPRFEVRTGLQNSNPLREGSVDPAWVTQVLMNNQPIVIWANDAEASWDEDNPDLTPPGETVTMDFTSTVACEEWAFESWSYGLVRPGRQNDMVQALYMKPVGTVHSSWLITTSGGSEIDPAPSNDTPPNLSNHYNKFDTMAEWANGFSEGDLSDYGGLVDNGFGLYFNAGYYAPTEGDLPFPAIFGEAAVQTFHGPTEWGGIAYHFNNPVAPAKAQGTPITKSDFQFQAISRPGTVSFLGVDTGSVYIVPDYTVRLKGDVIDWEERSLPVHIVNHESVYETPITSPISTGSKQENPGDYDIVPDDLEELGHDPADYDCITLKTGQSWSSMTLDHASSLVVETFVRSYPVGFAWTATGCTTSTVADGLRCVATGASPKIERNYRNDFNDIAPDTGAGPADWFSDYGAEIPDEVLLWFTTGETSPEYFQNSKAEWPKVRKKLRPDSDIFNWSTYRYLYVKAKADSACNLTLLVEYDNLRIKPNEAKNFAYNPVRQDFTVTIVVPLTTAMAEHEIDLPGLLKDTNEIIGQDGIQSIKKVTYSFPAGRIVTLNQLTLKEKNKTIVEVHHPNPLSDHFSIENFELGGITGITDGYRSLWLDGYSKWGFPIYEADETSNFQSCLLMGNLATEIGLQEGWSATLGDDPDDNGPDTYSPNFAIWLEETFGNTCPAILASKRGYGAVKVYPESNMEFEIKATVGFGAIGLIYDPDTHLPVSTRVLAVDPSDDSFPSLPAYIASDDYEIKDDSTSDSLGRFEHQLKDPIPLEWRSGPNTPDEQVYPIPLPISGPGGTDFSAMPLPTFSRGIIWLAFGGKGVFGSAEGYPVIVTSSDLDSFVVLVEDDTLKLARRMGAETAYTRFEIGTGLNGPWVVKNEANRSYPLYVVGHLDSGNLLLLKNTRLGADTDWKIKVVCPGKWGVVKYEEHLNLLYLSYWHNNNFYLRMSRDEGATWLTWSGLASKDALIKESVPEQHFSFDFLNTTRRTFVGVYFNAANELVTLQSTNLGETWT
jgi:hypothetical protein